MTSSPTNKRKCTVLPRSTVDYLKNWMMSPEHITHPYPTEKEKAEIMSATGIELKQLTNWFVNNRKRFWKPRVEARLQQHPYTQKTTSSVSNQSPQSTRNAVGVGGSKYNLIECSWVFWFQLGLNETTHEIFTIHRECPWFWWAKTNSSIQYWKHCEANNGWRNY
jgi:hypothetical protein